MQIKKTYINIFVLAIVIATIACLRFLIHPERVEPTIEGQKIYILWFGLLFGFCMLFAIRAFIYWLYFKRITLISYREIIFYVVLASLPLSLVDLVDIVTPLYCTVDHIGFSRLGLGLLIGCAKSSLALAYVAHFLDIVFWGPILLLSKLFYDLTKVNFYKILMLVLIVELLIWLLYMLIANA